MNDNEAIFQGLVPTRRKLGLSDRYLRQGCKNGTISHIKVGNRYMINVPALLEKLNRESMGDSAKE